MIYKLKNLENNKLKFYQNQLDLEQGWFCWIAKAKVLKGWPKVLY